MADASSPVDFAYPDVRPALEVDGWTARSSRRSFQSDLEWQNAFVAMGWTVLRFTWADVVRRPDRGRRRSAAFS